MSEIEAVQLIHNNFSQVFYHPSMTYTNYCYAVFTIKDKKQWN